MAILALLLTHWTVSVFFQSSFHHRYASHRMFTMSHITERVFFVPHGIDTSFFRPPEVRPLTRTCLCVGHWLRDFAMLKEAVELLRKEANEAIAKLPRDK